MKRSAAKGGFARTRAGFTINLSRSWDASFWIDRRRRVLTQFPRIRSIHAHGARACIDPDEGSRCDRGVRWLGPRVSTLQRACYLSFSNERLLSTSSNHSLVLILRWCTIRCTFCSRIFKGEIG